MLALPAVVFASASFGRRCRGRDRLWLGSRALSRSAITASTWLGNWAGGVALAAGIALAAEVAAGPAASAPRSLRDVPAPPALLVESGERAAWSVTDPESELAHGRSLRLTLATAPGSSPSALVRFRCARGDAASASEVRVHGRMSIELALPEQTSGTDDVVLSVEKLGEGCTVELLPDALALIEPALSARLASAELFLRVALFLGAWTALAMASALGCAP